MKKKSLSAAVTPKANAYAGMGDVLGAGFGDIINNSEYEVAVLKLSDIYIEGQIREEFEDADNTMEEMKDSVAEYGVFQSVLVRPMENGPAPYKLVAGERRYRASVLAGKTDIPALIKKMTDDEATTIQMQENIQRKNLTQYELAKRVQKDLDEMGSTELVKAKYKKGNAWLSQITALLKLPEQAKRLVSENISADLDAINSVKIIEKTDPAKAKALVDDLKESKGKENARKKIAEVKATVKPKAEKASAAKPAPAVDTTIDIFADAKTGTEQPAAAPVEQPESSVRPAPTETAWEILERAYSLITDSGSSPKMFWDLLDAARREDVSSWLRRYFDAGRDCKNVAQVVMKNLREKSFAQDSASAFNMIAFLQGVEAETVFDPLAILTHVKR